MCFSATASFTVAATLLTAGVVAVKKISEKDQLVFACIPLLFSVQQITEGFLWIALTDHIFSEWKCLLMYFFLLVAQFVWPVWVPLAFYLITKNPVRKKILGWLTVAGALVSLFLLYFLISYPAEVSIAGRHIFYATFYPEVAKIGAVFYFAAVIFPPFVCDMKGTWILGVLNLASYLISKIYFGDHVVSVWCFLAAAISVVIVVLILKNSKERKKTEDLIKTENL
jgi:hypothetical protein